MFMEILDLILMLIIALTYLIGNIKLRDLVEDYDKLTDELLESRFKDIETEFKLRVKIGELQEENKKLKEELNKSKKKNRIAKVIKEEKVNDKKRDISKD